MQIRFDASGKKNSIKLMIPGVEMGKDPFWIEIEEIVKSDTDDTAARCFITYKGKAGASQYPDSKLLRKNEFELVVSKIKGWNLIDTENKAVIASKENIAAFLNSKGHHVVVEKEESENGQEIDLYKFISDAMQDSKTFLSGDPKN